MTKPTVHLYQYRFKAIRARDGDTVEAIIDLGLKVTITDGIRLAGVDTPELHGEDHERGEAAKAFTEEWLQAAEKVLWLKSYEFRQFEKYGRVLGEIWRDDDPVCLSEALIAAGHVK